MNCLAVLGSSAGKESACNVGDLGSVPGLEDPLEEGMATHSGILAWRISMDRGAWRATGHGVAESDMTERLTHTQHKCPNILQIFYIKSL